jgi:protein-glucosylgalactosylhydroxylysine glucosidase
VRPGLPAALLVLALAPRAGAQPPREWVEPATGHRVVRLSEEPGSASLYFHQNPYTAQGDKLLISTPGGLATVELATRRITPLVSGRVSHAVVGPRTRRVFYMKGDTVYATHLDTGATRAIVTRAELRSGSGLTVNADETTLAGSYVEGPLPSPSPSPSAPPSPAVNPLAAPPPQESRLEARWAARLPMALYTLDIESGRVNAFHRGGGDWLNHVQFSPTDPKLLMFCHEGPWHKVDRIWTIRTDGSQVRLRHRRQMEMEIAGHEFWSADGKVIWYDLQTPKSKEFWLAGTPTAEGQAVRYPVAREHWSVHFNVSPDGRLFAGDGGGPASVAAPGNGQWIYLFRPRPDGRLEAERLVDLRRHDYQLEPNVTFTPDGKWIVFRSNMEGASHVYAVEVEKGAIDRKALVDRHAPVLRRFDLESPLTVGNGEFAFTADATGLQTFAEAYDASFPLATQSHWGWHTAPNPEGWSMERFHHAEFESRGRRVGYADIPGDRRTPEVEWLRANPHRLHLGRLGLDLTRADGRPAEAADLTDVEQRLDLWDGVIESRFRFEGRPVEVRTAVHPQADLVAVRVASPLLAEGRLALRLRFPYGTGKSTAADWTRPQAHQTTMAAVGPAQAAMVRRLDADTYHVRAGWSAGGRVAETAPHDLRFTPPPGAAAFELVAAFSSAPQRDELPGFDRTLAAARAHWNAFWSGGGAIDLSGSRDPRWRELERRIVLSQYLTAAQGSGSLPPQETGLSYNSWEGKFHLEMHWWHAAHFALWDRLPLLERSLGYYRDILPRAQATARRQGYAGARWPKMTGPRGEESPSTVGPFLVWQQPHPIFYAELSYRTRADRATLEQHRQVVFETAEFMASFPAAEEGSGRLVLGPPLQCAQEAFPKDRTFNCSFELAYWRWGLEAAQRWRQRLGLPREERWDAVLQRLARPALSEGKYLFAESAADTYTHGRWARDHPSVTAAFGLLPGAELGIDAEAMRRTLLWIDGHWDWPDTWGWDYPMLAMAAARLGEPQRAVDALLRDTPKNGYRANGHNPQRPGLTLYLPGNGGLLYAAAMMAAGWDGAPQRPAPGFPGDGSWSVRWEGLRPAP